MTGISERTSIEDILGLVPGDISSDYALMAEKLKQLADEGTELSNDSKPHEQASLAGRLFLHSLQMMKALKLDPAGCCILSGELNDRRSPVL